MHPLCFSIPGEVRGKGRPRLSTAGGFARAYTDPKTRAYEASIAAATREAMGSLAPFDGPLLVALQFRLSPPKSMSKRQRMSVLAGKEAYFGRVDVDNAAKSLLDAMNGIAFADDKQIIQLWLSKVAHEQPGVDVHLETVQPTARLWREIAA